MTAGRYRGFIASEAAGATVEFVALMPAFLLLTFFIAEVLVAVLWIGTAEKAAQLGARLAVVSNYAVTSLSPTTVNAPKSAAIAPGTNCDTGCKAFTAASCDGSTMAAPCDSTNFTAIVSRMQNIATLVQAQYVTITYSYTGDPTSGAGGLGFATGPIVPSVTVKLHGIPYNTVATAIMANFFKKATGDKTATSPLTTLPDISVTLTGEDLSSAGAS